MRNSSKLIFEKELNKVKLIKETNSRRKYDSEMHALKEIIDIYEYAEDLGYSEDILNKIKNSTNGIQAENILISARRVS